MINSFAPTTKPSIPGMVVCDGDGLTPKINPPKYSCDGGGLTPKIKLPTGGICTCAECTGDGEAKGKVGAKGILTTTILLIGGALLGYGHREHISKGVNALKTKVSEFFATGKPAEYLAKGKDLLAKAKDAIFVKPTV